MCTFENFKFSCLCDALSGGSPFGAYPPSHQTSSWKSRIPSPFAPSSNGSAPVTPSSKVFFNTPETIACTSACSASPAKVVCYLPIQHTHLCCVPHAIQHLCCCFALQFNKDSQWPTFAAGVVRLLSLRLVQSAL